MTFSNLSYTNLSYHADREGKAESTKQHEADTKAITLKTLYYFVLLLFLGNGWRNFRPACPGLKKSLLNIKDALILNFWIFASPRVSGVDPRYSWTYVIMLIF
jgi:hypothetical protein